jgi:pyridoxal phosphate enzyme (YggS family)
MIERLKANLAVVRQRIEDAARKSGRDASAIRLIAVTKYVDEQTTRALIEAGCQDIGENRPQMLWDKAAKLADIEVNWHMIGHLQRNKVKRTIAVASLIHSADSLRLLNAIDLAGQENNQIVPVLLEVNVSQEAAKHGFAPPELPAALDHVAGLQHIAVKGLMCMAGLAGDKQDARREFAQLRELAESHQANLAAKVRLAELSMGMSGDFEIAIEEGATMVRVGSLLLEGVL